VARIYFLAEAAGGAVGLPDESVETEQAIYRMRAGMPEQPE